MAGTGSMMMMMIKIDVVGRLMVFCARTGLTREELGTVRSLGFDCRLRLMTGLINTHVAG